MNNLNGARRVSDIMTKDVQYVPSSCSVEEAARDMGRYDVGALPVCDSGKLVGVVTDRDIALRGVARGQNPGSTSVQQVMSSDVAWCFDDASIDEVVQLMEERHLRRIPIVDRDKRLVGIVALADLARSNQPDELKAQGLEGVS